jgi:hypothetical protein
MGQICIDVASEYVPLQSSQICSVPLFRWILMLDVHSAKGWSSPPTSGVRGFVFGLTWWQVRFMILKKEKRAKKGREHIPLVRLN